MPTGNRSRTETWSGRGPELDTEPFGELSALSQRENWMDKALCPQVDPDIFFPEKGGSTREAKRMCLSCEVRDECLEYALNHDERYGIWGGYSERERRRLRADRAVTESVIRVAHCEVCDGAIAITTNKGPERKYCSQICREIAWKRRNAA